MAEIIAFKSNQMKGMCDCAGQLIFDLYNGDVLNLSFTLHHQQSLRIVDLASYDLEMTLDSRQKLKQWLEDIGIENLP